MWYVALSNVTHHWNDPMLNMDFSKMVAIDTTAMDWMPSPAPAGQLGIGELGTDPDFARGSGQLRLDNNVF